MTQGIASKFSTKIWYIPNCLANMGWDLSHNLDMALNSQKSPLCFKHSSQQLYNEAKKMNK